MSNRRRRQTGSGAACWFPDGAAPGREAGEDRGEDRQRIRNERADGPVPAQRQRRVGPGRKGKGRKPEAGSPVRVMTWRNTGGTLPTYHRRYTARCLTDETRTVNARN